MPEAKPADDGIRDPLTLRPPTFVKKGWIDGGERVRHEAAVLGDARHPGVVEVVHVRDDGDSCELHLAVVDGDTLAAGEPRELDELLNLVISVGRTLCDLHHRGVRHGNVRSDHVLLDNRNRTVLCGFGDAGRAGESRAPLASADIAGFGRLILTELSKSEEAGVIGSEDRRAWAVRSLAEDAATVDDPDSTLDEYVQRLAILAAAEPPRARPVVRPQVLAVVVGVVAIAFVVGWRAVRPPTAPPQSAAVTEPEPAPETSLAVTGSDSEVAEPPPTATLLAPAPAFPGCPTTDDDPSAVRVDVDDDGCPEDIRVDGRVITAGARRWSVGQDGDRLLIGDFHCTGRPLPAIVRPATGAVFIFGEWPLGSTPVRVPSVATLDDPLSARVTRDGECDVIASSASGEQVRVGPSGELPA